MKIQRCILSIVMLITVLSLSACGPSKAEIAQEEQLRAYEEQLQIYQGQLQDYQDKLQAQLEREELLRIEYQELLRDIEEKQEQMKVDYEGQLRQLYEGFTQLQPEQYYQESQLNVLKNHYLGVARDYEIQAANAQAEGASRNYSADPIRQGEAGYYFDKASEYRQLANYYKSLASRL